MQVSSDIWQLHHYYKKIVFMFLLSCTHFANVFFQAFWYTEEKGVEGPVFGSNDYWKGLAVFMDSFDNDAAVS